jgi:hypothetical protein
VCPTDKGEGEVNAELGDDREDEIVLGGVVTAVAVDNTGSDGSAGTACPLPEPNKLIALGGALLPIVLTPNPVGVL